MTQERPPEFGTAEIPKGPTIAHGETRVEFVYYSNGCDAVLSESSKAESRNQGLQIGKPLVGNILFAARACLRRLLRL